MAVLEKPLTISIKETVNKPRVSELDQIGERLNPYDYIVKQKEYLLQLWNPSERLTKSGLERDNFVGEVFVSAPDGVDSGMVGVVSYLGSDIVGLHGTGMTWYFTPDNVEEWIGMDQQARRSKFENEVLPNVSRVMTYRHGWGGRRAGQEEHIRSLIHNPRSESEGVLLSRGMLIGAPTVMGGEDTLDVPNRMEFDNTAIQAQVVEVQDHANIHLTEARLRAVFNNKTRRDTKIEILRAVDRALVDREPVGIDSLVVDAAARLLKMEDEEHSLSALKHIDQVMVAEMGHSMGAWAALREFFDIWINPTSVVPEKYLGTLKPALKAYARRVGDLFSQSKKQFEEELFFAGRGGKLVELYEKKFAHPEMSDYWFDKEVSLTMKGRLPNALIVGVDPVIEGNDVTDFDQHIGLGMGARGLALNTLDSLHSESEARQAIHSVGNQISEATGVRSGMLDYFIGTGALGYPLIKTGHSFTMDEEVFYHLQCQVNLKQMSLVAGVTTQRGIRGREESLNHLLVAVSPEDKVTLAGREMRLIDTMEKQTASIDGAMPDFWMSLADSDHYPLPEEWEQLGGRIWEKVWQAEQERALALKHKALDLLVSLGLRRKVEGVTEIRSRLATSKEIDAAIADTHLLLDQSKDDIERAERAVRNSS